MKLNTHANLLSIFSFVIGGLQLLLTLFLGLYVLMIGLAAVVSIVDTKPGSDEGAIIFGILTIVFGIFVVLGFIASFFNLYLGFRLRKATPVSKNLLVFASGLNCLNFLWGGLLPGAFGVYGMWFALSDASKNYFAGNVYQTEPVYNFPPAPAQYGTGTQQQGQHNEPYRWQ